MAIKAVQMEGATLASSACQKKLVNFQENMRLVRAASALAGFAWFSAGQNAEAGTQAAISVLQEDYHLKFPDASSDELRQIFLKTGENLGKIVAKNSPLIEENIMFATGHLEQFGMCCGPFVHAMLVGTLKSICIQTWTSIEVLFEDLHGSSIDEHPALFSEETIRKHDNWKKFASEDSFSFRSRKGFIPAYKKAFEKDYEIQSCVNHESIHAMIAIRNLLVHKGGIADEPFIKNELKSAPQLAYTFPGIEDGKALIFDGGRVRFIIDAALVQAYKLIREVDRWICNKQKSVSQP